MTLDGLIRMLGRRLFGRLMNWGITRGTGMAAGGGRGTAARTPGDRARARPARDLAKRARKAARITRRF